MPFREWPDISTALDFDAHDDGSITLNGSNVSQWADLSGNNRHVSQGTSSLQPAYSAAGLNSLPAVVWDGSGRKLIGSWATTLTARAVFIVFSHSGAGTNTRPFSQWLSGYDDWTTPGWVLPVCRDISASTFGTEYSGGRVSQVPVTWNTPLLFSSIHGSGVITTRLNGGVQMASASVALNTTVSNFILGTNPGSDDARLIGPIAKLVVLDYLPDADTIALIEGALAWECGIEGSLAADHPYKTAPPFRIQLRAILHQPYALEIDGRRAVLDQLYPLTNPFFAKIEQIWGLRMLVALDMPYGNMPLKRAVLHMPLEDCKPFRRSLPMEYGDARQYRAILDNEWNLSAGLRAILVERYSIADHQVRGAFEQLYDLQDRDLLRSQLNQIYAMAAGLALVQRHEIEVTCDGQAITSMVNINIEQDEGLFHMSGELQLADQAEFLLFQEYASEIVIPYKGINYVLMPEKVRKSRPETGVNVYIVPLASPTLLLDSPHATPITGTFSGMAKSIVEDLAGSFTVDWQLVDWFIPPGKLAANSEPPISIIKKIVSAAGGVVQTSPSGVLVCRPEYPVSVNLWATTEPDIELTDQDDFFSLDPQPELRDGYNEFFVSDQQLASGGLRKETEKTGDYTALIRVYQVPWDSKSIVREYHSGGSWVSLVANGIIEEAITEQIEIIEGAGQVSKPCYREVSHEYRVVDLGELTITEAGEVTTATAGYSLVSITYITRNWQFTATDYRDEDVQFYTEAI